MKGGKEVMKYKICNKPALVVSLFVAGLHALWAILVVLGIGQTVMDWIFPLHFIDSMYTVTGFNFINAILLVITAFVGGYIATSLFVWLWKAVKIK